MEGTSQFPPGFRFHPTDQELIIHYLSNKISSSNSMITGIIADVDIYKYNPWDLPDKAFFGEGEWFFFSPRDRKYPNGGRPNRAAASGYWKATGTDKPILASGGSKCLGVKKALVFYKGRPPKGIKTDWVMHEYRLLDAAAANWTQNQKHKGSMRLDDWVLCRVRHKGCLLPQSDEEIVEARPPVVVAVNQNTPPPQQQQQALRERTNNDSVCDWSDNQLLDYLLGSQDHEDAGDSHSDISELCSPQSSKGILLPAPDQVVSSVFDSIKRTLSFGVLDELMLQPPSKRGHYSTNYSTDQSSGRLFSVDQEISQFWMSDLFT